MANRHEIGSQFEAEVRLVARAIWDSHPGDGAPEMFAGRERDCIFHSEDLTHYIECTTSTKLEKLKEDLSKLIDYRKQKASHGKLVKLWMITQKEPTADQRTYARQNSVELLSLQEFRRRIIDGPKYTSARANAPFGSAADPTNESPSTTRIRYQPTAIRDNDGLTLTIAQVANSLLSREQFVLLGDFGMGKSITIREIFFYIRNALTKGHTALVPIALNLRDHWGQQDPSEALERHAKRIGYDKPAQLVRALYAGQLIVLLDGFDEIAPSPWNTRATPRLRELRRSAVELVAEFAKAVRGNSGFLVAGRSHFFDSRDEMLSAFDMRGRSRIIDIGEFSDDEYRAFLTAQGINQDLPDWLPRRPLLLATLIAQGHLDDVMKDGKERDPATAWDHLLDSICRREARTQKPLDAEAIRNMLETLASVARGTSDGYGPITEEHIAEAFRLETGAHPDDAARPLLNRLPGLAVQDAQRGTRRFMDAQLVDSLRAGAVAKFLMNPYEIDPKSRSWQHGLASIGIALLARRARDLRPQNAAAYVAGIARQAAEKWDSGTLALDLVQAARKLAPETEEIRFDGLTIVEGNIDSFDLSEGPRPIDLKIDTCAIEELVLSGDPASNFEIRSSDIRQIRGCGSTLELPPWIIDCEISNFDEIGTNAQIMDKGDIPLPVRTLVTILRKLYVQKGHGREERALNRGVNQKARHYVSKLLPMVAQERLAVLSTSSGDRVWHPVAGMRSRAQEIIRKPQMSNDPLVLRAKSLQE
ncbi:hypothetical protein WME97_46300 [Sorangium sp. So ce367]|uniref:NACHT domain-containing protein n=1 Tax=Sorangium sp. So ce367 TaxID=3133305 RepID=UPI003F5E86C1